MTPAAYRLDDRRILVVGAAGGIGCATAGILASLGARLVLADRVPCQTALEAVRAVAGDASETTVDINDDDAADRLAMAAGDIDALVLGAGLYRGIDWDGEDWCAAAQESVSTNLLAPMRLARTLVPAMARRGGGRVVFVGSIVATTGGSFPGVGPHYAVAKGGLHTLVRWLAARYTPEGILVNGVAPGITATAMVAGHDLQPVLARHPMQRAATPQEIAWPIAFLCSPAASFISGAIIDVNGGALMRP